MSNSVQDQVNSAVESAREAAVKVGESVGEFFQGNPFSTTVGKKIEQATDATTLATENWGLNMEIVDFINHTENGANEAFRAIRKRLQTQMAKNNATVMFTLTVLETCVKNGNYHFHSLVCNKTFVEELVRLIGPKYDAPQIIQERVLSLIQAWADAFKNDPALQDVVRVYEDLKAKGVEFPATDLDSLAPIITPKKTVFTQPASGASGSRQSPPRQLRQTEVTAEILPISEARSPVELNQEQMAKLRKDIDVVHTNIKVFRDLLTEIEPGKESSEELDLMTDLHVSLKSMQQRILDLVRIVSNETVIFELLVLNDEFNSIFEKYERRTANKNGEDTSVPQEASGDLLNLSGDTTESLGDQLAALKVVQAKQPSPTRDSYAANAEQQAAVDLSTATAQRSDDAPPALPILKPTHANKDKEEDENDKL